MPVTGHLGRSTAHHAWDRDEPPALVIAPGSEVELDLRDPSDGQIVASTAAEELNHIEIGRMDPLTGPIFVEGAEPGDAISVEILDIAVASFGWSGIMPGLGLLSDHFRGPYLRKWELEGKGVELDGGHFFDFRPMLGVIGVAPAEAGKFASVVPTDAGGNIDVKYTRVGSRIMLPVFNEGALISVGDTHALQGDGELSGTAIECQSETVLRIGLEKGAGITAPIIETARGNYDSPEQMRSFLGIGPDLYAAAQEAALRATEALTKALRVDAHVAYALLGTVAELRIHEVVDRPNWVVGCMLPSRLFG